MKDLESFIHLYFEFDSASVEVGKMGGKPCIRGLCFSFYDLASYLALGMTEDQILEKLFHKLAG